MSAFDFAKSLVASGALEPPPYRLDGFETTISLKIEGREPEDLTTPDFHDLLQQSLSKHVHPHAFIHNIYTQR